MAKEMGLNLTAVDDLFSTQQEREDTQLERIVNLPLNKILDFPGHPFKVKIDDKLLEMQESIEKYGVLIPAIVRPKEGDSYEMIAGHRRKLASGKLGKEVMPCIVRDLSDDEAILIMVDSNFQREEILPSEKAFAYKMKLEAIKRQGERSDLASPPMADKSKGKVSAEILADQVGESKDQIWRYIRLTNLIEPILNLVDEKKIGFRPAVELSYLSSDQQTSLLDAMELEDCTPSHAQAINLKKFAQEGKLNDEVIYSILSEEKPNQKEQFRMPKDRITKYFPPGTPVQKMEDTIIKALEMYRKRNRDMER